MNVRSGFLCIELLVGLAIIAGFALLVAYQQATLLCWQHEQNMRQKALDACTLFIERSMIVGQMPTESTFIDADLVIEWHTQPYHIAMPFKGTLLKTDPGILVEVSVSWQARDGKQHHVTVTTIMQELA